MNIDYEIAVPGFISGFLLGVALIMSRFVLVAVSTLVALYILWVLFESGEYRLAILYQTLIYDKILPNKLFFLSFAAGFLIAILTFTKK